MKSVIDFSRNKSGLLRIIIFLASLVSLYFDKPLFAAIGIFLTFIASFDVFVTGENAKIETEEKISTLKKVAEKIEIPESDFRKGPQPSERDRRFGGNSKSDYPVRYLKSPLKAGKIYDQREYGDIRCKVNLYSARGQHNWKPVPKTEDIEILNLKTDTICNIKQVTETHVTVWITQPQTITLQLK